MRDKQLTLNQDLKVTFTKEEARVRVKNLTEVFRFNNLREVIGAKVQRSPSGQAGSSRGDLKATTEGRDQIVREEGARAAALAGHGEREEEEADNNDTSPSSMSVRLPVVELSVVAAVSSGIAVSSVVAWQGRKVEGDKEQALHMSNRCLTRCFVVRVDRFLAE